MRQKDPALKEAVEQLARGDVFGAIDNLDQQGRVHEIVGREDRFSEIAREYARQPQGTLVISPDNESRRELNGLIHREMQQRGDVSHERAQAARARLASGDDGSRSAMGRAVRGRGRGALYARQQSAGHRARRVRARGAGET